MSVYRRFISYMYDHLQNSKGKNCGFVKVEIKNSKCTISFQLKHAPCQETCNVYLYCPTEVSPFLYAGSIPIQKGTTNQKLTLNSLHIADSTIPFSKCAGLLCTDENGNDCCTCWTDQTTIPAYKPPKETISIAENTAVDDVFTVNNHTVNTDENQVAPNNDISGNIFADDIVTDDTATDDIATDDLATDDITTDNDIVASHPILENPPQESPEPSQPRSFSNIWAHLQEELPSLDPFEDDAIVETIKITPSDLGYLQSCKLNLGTNQFLLHGYKNYHHLILGRIHGQMQYIIGIPGVYDSQEQFMAKMFGFPCFKPIRECRKKNGQFGYWMRCFR